MAKLFTVKSNSEPSIIITLERSGTAIDVTGATVDLFINLNGTVINTGHTSCALTTPVSGIVTYDLTAADTATPGLANCEVRITYSGGGVETIYQKFQLNIRDNLQ